MHIYGQEDTIRALRALAERRMPVLLVGAPGTGKSLLARLYCSQVGPFDVVSCEDPAAPAMIAMAFGTGTGLVLDEIHCLKQPEFLYPYLDKIGSYAVAATTTNEGLLPEALRSRLFTVAIAPYTISDLTAIVKNATGFSDAVSKHVASLSRGSPRRAFQLSMLLRSATNEIRSPRDAETLLSSFGFSAGLNHREIRYLELVARKPRSINTLASALATDPATVHAIESHLIFAGLVEITSKGRTITSQGLDALQKALGKHILSTQLS